MNLEDFGWNSFFENHSARHRSDNLIPARISFQGKGIYRLISRNGEIWAEIAGALRNEIAHSQDPPVVGDWVLADDLLGQDRTIIRILLPRRTLFSRKQAGTSIGQQAIAANLDTVFLVSGLDSDYNPRRIERYLAIAWESGVRPVIILNKADLCLSIDDHLAEAMSVAPGVPVLAVSATECEGIENILNYIGPGQTAAFLGSSGVGKSSIVNRLLGRSAQEIREIDASTGRGLHTTTARQLFLLPSGGMIMDTPGMRELQIWSADEGIDTVFDDIKALGEGCRFRDCRHQTEPGCRVRQAIEQGELDSKRFANYMKLRNEAHYVELKTNHSANYVEKERWKKVAKAIRKLPQNRS